MPTDDKHDAILEWAERVLEAASECGEAGQWTKMTPDFLDLMAHPAVAAAVQEVVVAAVAAARCRDAAEAVECHEDLCAALDRLADVLRETSSE